MARFLTRGTLAVFLASFISAPAAFAQSAEKFYAGKTLTLVTAAGAAGPYNILARTIEPYLKKHLVGHPDIIVQAMPGAGGLLAANYLYNIAPKDGSVIGISLPTIAMNQAFSVMGLKYDSTKFNYLLSIQQEPIVLGVWSKSGVDSWETALKKEVVLGSTGITSNTYIVPRMMNQFLGTKFKIVSGYQGAGLVELAIERGEVDGMGANWSGLKSSKPEWIKNKQIKVIVQTGLKREPDLPDVPTLIDLSKTDEQRSVFTFYALSGSLGRVLIAPPKVPQDRIDALRAALVAVAQDPEFQKLAKERDIDPHPVLHDALEKLAADTVAFDPKTVAKVKAALTVGK
jgi:tripartite-type tricarboxylate transporter receptor subunit TctC